MLELWRVKELPFLIQIFNHFRVGLLHKQTGVGRLLRHAALAVHELYKGQIVFAAHLRVVLTESRGNMHDTGTVRHCDIVVTSYIVRFLFLSGRLLARAGKEGFILLVFQIRAHIGFQHFISRRVVRSQLAEYRIQKRLCHIVGIAVRRLHLHIGFHGIHAERHVRGQSPRRCRPCQKVSVLAHHLKPGDGRAFLHRLVALGHLVG